MVVEGDNEGENRLAQVSLYTLVYQERWSLDPERFRGNRVLL